MSDFVGGLIIGMLIVFTFSLFFFLCKMEVDSYIENKMNEKLSIWEQYQLRKQKEGKK